MTWRRAAALAFLAAIIALSLLLPPVWKGRISSTGLLHHSEHVLAFCVAFVLAGYPSAEMRRNFAAALGLLAFAMLLEALQTAVYGISLEYIDILDDALGVSIGLVAFKARYS